MLSAILARGQDWERLNPCAGNVDKMSVNPSAQENPVSSRKVGLDKPCGLCGTAIYFNYQGPLDGVCGNCTDDLRRRLNPRGRSAGPVIQKTRVQGLGWGSVVLAFVAGAAAAVIVLVSGILPL